MKLSFEIEEEMYRKLDEDVVILQEFAQSMKDAIGSNGQHNDLVDTFIDASLTRTRTLQDRIEKIKIDLNASVKTDISEIKKRINSIEDDLYVIETLKNKIGSIEKLIMPLKQELNDQKRVVLQNKEDHEMSLSNIRSDISVVSKKIDNKIEVVERNVNFNKKSINELVKTTDDWFQNIQNQLDQERSHFSNCIDNISSNATRIRREVDGKIENNIANTNKYIKEIHRIHEDCEVQTSNQITAIEKSIKKIRRWIMVFGMMSTIFICAILLYYFTSVS